MNHRIGRNLFALAVGLAVAVLAFLWVSDPEPGAQRAAEERAVLESRALLYAVIANDSLEIVDPLAPDRKVGKVYVYEEPPGWAVSGFYRRDADDRWHPYLLTMNGALELEWLKVQDPALEARAQENPVVELLP